MNAVDRVFPKSAKLLCRYHTSCNVRGNYKGKTGLDEESAEFGIIMAAWETILDSENEESYADSVIRLRQLCIPFPTFIEYVESTILRPVKEKVVTAWTKRHMHLSNTTTNRRFEKSKIETTKQLEGNLLFSHVQRNISREGVNRLVKEVNRLDVVDLVQEGRPTLSLEPEWAVIQAIFRDADYSMQLQMKERFWEFAYPETTSILPPPHEVKTKGANKRVRLSQRERYTHRDPSFFEHMDRRHQVTPRSSSQNSARKSNQSPAPRPTPPPRPAPAPPRHKWHPDVHQPPLFMPDYFDDVINVKGDEHREFRAAALLLGKSVDDHIMILLDLITELNRNRA
ncbi:hypothetical protein QL285_070488 [Trifolium repens]|nr:hypothetical protein QL285_070488 [Trifolium repens]